MPEGLRRTDRAEAADAVAVAANMRAEAAMHRDAAHRVVAAIAGVAARHVADETRRLQPDIPEPAAPQQHLVERRHPACGRIAAAARHSGRLELRRIVPGFRIVGVGATLLLARRDAG